MKIEDPFPDAKAIAATLSFTTIPTSSRTLQPRPSPLPGGFTEKNIDNLSRGRQPEDSAWRPLPSGARGTCTPLPPPSYATAYIKGRF